MTHQISTTSSSTRDRICVTNMDGTMMMTKKKKKIRGCKKKLIPLYDDDNTSYHNHKAIMVLDTSTIIVGSIPAVCMLLFTIVGLKIKVPDALEGALQHFAAGVLLSAVGSELLPTLLKAKGVEENVYATIGFFLGMGVLIVLGALLPEAHFHGGDDDHDDHGHGRGSTEFEENIGAQKRRASTASTSLRGMMALDSNGKENTKALSLRQAAKAINTLYCTSCDRIEEVGAEHEGQALLSSARSGSGDATLSEHVAIFDKALPLSFLAAIVVDSIMDSFLIGITGAAGPDASIIMAGSLSVEMSFVGLTLATACHGMPYSKAIPAALAGPITLVIGSILLHHNTIPLGGY